MKIPEWNGEWPPSLWEELCAQWRAAIVAEVEAEEALYAARKREQKIHEMARLAYQNGILAEHPEWRRRDGAGPQQKHARRVHEMAETQAHALWSEIEGT